MSRKKSVPPQQNDEMSIVSAPSSFDLLIETVIGAYGRPLTKDDRLDSTVTCVHGAIKSRIMKAVSHSKQWVRQHRKDMYARHEFHDEINTKSFQFIRCGLEEPMELTMNRCDNVHRTRVQKRTPPKVIV